MKSNGTLQPTNTQTSGYLVIFGVVLILIGVIGYVTNPEKAATALISGGVFGALWMLWGILSARGFRGSWLAALVTTAVLMAASAWRAYLGWLAVANGQSEKAFAVVLITVMFAIATTILLLLLKDKKSDGAKMKEGTE